MLNIKNVQEFLISPDDRIIRNADKIFLAVYFGYKQNPQVECIFLESGEEDIRKGSIVINLPQITEDINFTVIHEQAIVEINKVFPELELEIK